MGDVWRGESWLPSIESTLDRASVFTNSKEDVRELLRGPAFGSSLPIT